MLKKISVAVLATALLASPVFAAKPKITPPPAAVEKCGTPAILAKAIESDGAKVEYDISGDNLAKLNAYIANKYGPQAAPPVDTDRVIVVSKPGVPWLGILFVKGCAKQAFPVDPDSFKKMYEKSQGESV